MNIKPYLIAFYTKKDFKALQAQGESLNKYQHPCPANAATKRRCEGYIIDHIIPLACGGEDSPENMQWQTEEDAKAKDEWERVDCQIYSSYVP